MAGKRPNRVKWLIVSLFLTTAAVVPVAWFVGPHAIRWNLLGKLTSPDLDQRQRGLNYVIRRAGERPLVFSGAVQKAGSAIDADDRENFLQIANALQLAGKWRHTLIPADLWLYWIDSLAADSDADARIIAAQQLAQLHDLASDKRLPKMLGRQYSDENEEVRYNVLIASAELAGCTNNNGPHTTLIARATQDAVPAIAREAWIFLGLLRATEHATPGAADLPDEVTCAIVWATTGEYDVRWRQAVVPSDGTAALLADLEHMEVGELLLAVAPEWSDTLRIAAVAVSSAPEPADLRRALDSPMPAVRDSACVVAAERFSAEQNEALIKSLLADFSDNAKRSGAILAGLTGLQSQLLEKKMQDEDIWAVRQIHRLGVWMQGRLPEMDEQVQGLLTRDDLPTTTILLAMLHRTPVDALEIILSPRVDELQLDPSSLNLPETEGDAPVSLKMLLVHYCWHRVLRRYLPEDAPPLSLWADDGLQQFQIDVLRNWYLVNRHLLKHRTDLTGAQPVGH